MLPRANLKKSYLGDKNYKILQCIRYIILAFNWFVTQRKYKAETNPFRIIWVDPNEVYDKRISCPRPRLPICLVVESDFDQHNTKKVVVQDQLKQRMIEGVKWEDTERHEILLNNYLKKGKSEDDLYEYYNNQIKLYKNIKENGFIPPKGVEYGSTGIELNWKPKSIAVNVGRDGGFYLYTGSHRLRIAKILNLKQIPVRVSARHTEWQKIRETLYHHKKSRNKDFSCYKKFLNHPDIIYLQ